MGKASKIFDCGIVEFTNPDIYLEGSVIDLREDVSRISSWSKCLNWHPIIDNKIRGQNG